MIDAASVSIPATTVDNRVLLLIIDDFATPLGQRAHGEYVLEAATAAYHSVYSGHHIVMHTVNYAPEPTLQSVIDRTRAKFDALSAAAGTPYDIVVLNMSWVILGCTGTIDVGGNTITLNIKDFYAAIQEKPLQYDLNADNVISLVEYIIGTNELNPELEPDVVTALAGFVADTSTLDTDVIAEFNNLLGGALGTNSTFSGTTVPVAAAGNFSSAGSPLPPLNPAAWPAVIAVSGSIADDPTTMWDSSHNGQLMAPAAWHPTITDEYVSGTSFATPLVSVFISYMAQSHTCNFAPILGLIKESNADFLTEVIANC